MEGKTLDLIEGDQKKRKSENAEENDQNSPDRISSLPDEIICYILSFVPTTNVVQTCILSRRWQNIWIYVPNLYLDDELVTGEIGTKHFEKTMTTRIKFRNLLNNFLMRCVSSSVPINLKRMHLDSINLPKNFHHQLSNCPNLAKLYLNEFFIDLDYPCSDTFKDHSGILPNLDDVFIGTIYNYQPAQEIGGWLGAFIRKLSNVKNLHLTNANILKFLQYSEVGLLNNLPTFCNLKHLNLGVNSEDDSMVEVVACLLQRSPFLESLQLSYVFSLSWPQKFQGTPKPQECLYNCQLGKLKKITVHNFWGSEKQIDLARLFFGNVQLKIIVHITAVWYNSFSLRRKLLEFPRLSKLVLVYDCFEEKVMEEVFNANRLFM